MVLQCVTVYYDVAGSKNRVGGVAACYTFAAVRCSVLFPQDS